jgi:hypothetical protein
MTTAARKTRNEVIAELAYNYKQLSAQAAGFKAQADDVMAQLLPLLPEDGQPLKDLKYEGKEIQVTRVQASSEYLDEAAFRKSLPTRIWNKISRRVIDQNMLAVAITNGDITQDQVDKFKQKRKNNPFARITIKGF